MCKQTWRPIPALARQFANECTVHVVTFDYFTIGASSEVDPTESSKTIQEWPQHQTFNLSVFLNNWVTVWDWIREQT